MLRSRKYTKECLRGRLMIADDSSASAGSAPVPADLGAVRAKMICHGIDTSQYGPDETHKTHKVRLGAIYSTEGENKAFTESTPSGECWMQIAVGRPALEFFKPGKYYHVTFTEAPPK